ncbi:hypothetical protein BV22DRAFT_1042360 [Leucogyrophana mollusca]|uniref:Uncharacterized protein n=1 Tax=Leucogyrophana mollusca TaxID=85980 RepID=A0ACB8AX27_9AGAM|nr:hypothetical protein BV22DRAFT_1042360 [Leucogyrophana mollusca]
MNPLLFRVPALTIAINFSSSTLIGSNTYTNATSGIASWFHCITSRGRSSRAAEPHRAYNVCITQTAVLTNQN